MGIMGRLPIRRAVSAAIVTLLLAGHAAAASFPVNIRFGGFFPGSTGLGTGGVAAADATLGRPINPILTYMNWGDQGANVPPPEWFSSNPNRDIVITWEPWMQQYGAYQFNYRPSQIARGRFDAYVHTWAKALAAQKRTVYLRPLHEMNGTWYPWGAIMGNTPADYTAAWRHMHDIFVTDGATNVKWIWSVNYADVPASNTFERYWPGSQYVDVLGISGYNWGNTQSWSHWQSFDEIFGPAYNRISKLGNEPIWITEMATAKTGGDPVAWINQMFIQSANYSRLQAILWFNVNKETDWRITADPKLSKLFSAQ
jgi:beta-mannanase